MSMIRNLIASALLAGAISAKTIPVDVGKNGLTYSQNSITADVGDQVVFTFYPKNHTVNQASFSEPCTQEEKGFFSGFVPTASGAASNQFVVTVNDTQPIWFYCGQADHCQSGMVGVINQAKTGNKTIEAFTSAARLTKTSVNPQAARGGVFQPLGSSNNSSTTSAVPSPAPSTGTSSGQSGNNATYSPGSPSSNSGSSSTSSTPSSTSKTAEASSLGLRGWIVAAAAVVAGAAVYIV